MAQTADPQAEVRRLYEAAEGELSRAAEKAVDTEGFASLLGLMTSNIVAVGRIATTTFDLTLRNLRLAGRRDIVRLATQLNRTEDKLEHLLAEVEELRADLASGSDSRSTTSRRRSTTSGNGKA
jgi:methyl-accepting chemotaxis protein